jgi:peptide/nickel transport system substrate-binding protein
MHRGSIVKSFFLIPVIVILTVMTGWAATGQPNQLVIGTAFGPSVAVPDPAKGSNGWYTNEAGVTETLFVHDFDMQLKPWLAESYRNLSPVVWEIKLRHGVIFHDRQPMNAASVKRSFERLIDEKSVVFNKLVQGQLDIKSITVVDELTLNFETRHPNASFLYELSSSATAIVNPDSGASTIFATGPFQLAAVTPKERMVVSRFDGYWGEKASLETVVLNVIANPATRMLAFESGQLDIATGFPEIDAVRIASRKNTRIVHQPTNRLCFFFVRVKDGPLATPQVRKALNHAIDRRQIVDTVLSGIGGEVGASVFPATLPWNNAKLKPYAYDPKRAVALLAEAGATDGDGDGIVEIDGHPLMLNMWTYETRASLKPTLELVQAQLARVGIASRLKVTRKGSPINQAMRRGQVHLNLQMWNAAPQGDPDFFISRLFTTHAGSNFMGYHNPELDDLAQKGKTTFDPVKRKQIYDRIQTIIYEESPVIVLFHKSMVSAVNDRVDNYRIHPAETYLVTPQLGRH